MPVFFLQIYRFFFLRPKRKYIFSLWKLHGVADFSHGQIQSLLLSGALCLCLSLEFSWCWHYFQQDVLRWRPRWLPHAQGYQLRYDFPISMWVCQAHIIIPRLRWRNWGSEFSEGQSPSKDRACYGGIVSPPSQFTRWSLNPHPPTSECDLYRGNQSKMKSLGWAVIQTL